MTFKYVWKKKLNKETGVYACKLKCGKLRLFDVVVQPDQNSGKKTKFAVIMKDLLFCDSKFDAIADKSFKSVDDVLPAIQKVFETKLSKLEVE